MEEKSKEKIEKSFDAKQYNILTVGRICEEKGQDIIPAIALKLKEKEINYRTYTHYYIRCNCFLFNRSSY